MLDIAKTQSQRQDPNLTNNSLWNSLISYLSSSDRLDLDSYSEYDDQFGEEI